MSTITSDEILNSKTYQKLEAVKKLIYGKKNMLDKVKEEYVIAKHIGLQTYVKDYHPIPYLQSIIKELLEINN